MYASCMCECALFVALWLVAPARLLTRPCLGGVQWVAMEGVKTSKKLGVDLFEASQAFLQASSAS